MPEAYWKKHLEKPQPEISWKKYPRLSSPSHLTCLLYTSNKIQGTGLGMAITRNLVEAMGGTIDLELALIHISQLLSDNSHFPLRVSIFDVETKGSNLFSVREFGNDCLLYSLDELLRYGDVLNLIQADETDRIVERKAVSYTHLDVYKRQILVSPFLYSCSRG